MSVVSVVLGCFLNIGSSESAKAFCTKPGKEIFFETTIPLARQAPTTETIYENGKNSFAVFWFFKR